MDRTLAWENLTMGEIAREIEGKYENLYWKSPSKVTFLNLLRLLSFSLFKYHKTIVLNT